jgi:RIO kinase 1
MEFVGDDAGRGRRLAEVTIENPETAFGVVREYVRRLYDAGLVHGDLSEYNLVVHDGELVVIDLGQAVTVHHPNAGEFLERDCRNVADFFSGLGVDVTGEDLLAYVKREADPEREVDAGGREHDPEWDGS